MGYRFEAYDDGANIARLTYPDSLKRGLEMVANSRAKGERCALFVLPSESVIAGCGKLGTENGKTRRRKDASNADVH